MISAVDVDSIYKIPGLLHAQGLDEIVCRKLELQAPPANLADWDELVYALEHPRTDGQHRAGRQVRRPDRVVQVAVRGADPRRHPQPARRSRSTTSTPRRIEQERHRTACATWTRSWCPGGFGKRGVEGKITAIRYARENKVPYLGICLGMQLAVIEYARHRAGLAGAHSTEFDPNTPHPVIALITEWQDRDGQARAARRPAPTWAAPCAWAGRSARCCPGSLARQIYGQERVVERHRHRYEVNNHYLPQLMNSGMRVIGHVRHRRTCPR